MKKIISGIFAMLLLVLLAGCGSKYKLDGQFTAFEVTVHEDNDNEVAQVTWVTVTIEKGKITKFFLDERQSEMTEEGNVWNVKTKKELKEEYGMTVIPGTIQVEWYLQAEAIEAKWLEDGVDSIEVNNEKYITNMEGKATMVDSNYSKLAKKALEYAENGVSVAFEVTDFLDDDGISTAQITWVEATIEKGKVTNFFLDERQSTVADGKLKWNTKTKKELKEEYGMTVIPGTIQVEWYLQAEAIEAKWLEDGVDSIQVNNDKYITNMEGKATMVDSNYSKLAKASLKAVNVK